MVSPRSGALLVALLVLARPALAQDGRLDRVGEATRDGGHGDDGDPFDEAFDDDSWDWQEGDERGGFFEDPLGSILAWTVQLPFLVPRSALGDDGGPTCFAEFPGAAGFWHREGEGVARRWSVRPRLERGTDFDALERTGFGLELEHASRFGLDLAWSHWREDLEAGGTDSLDLADANVVVRFAQNARTAWRAGLGLNVLHDEHGEELGINGTYAATFLLDPFSAGFELDLGTLGDATLVHGRLELGWTLRRLGLLASYDTYDIDGVELHAFTLGTRLWL